MSIVCAFTSKDDAKTEMRIAIARYDVAIDHLEVLLEDVRVGKRLCRGWDCALLLLEGDEDVEVPVQGCMAALLEEAFMVGYTQLCSVYEGYKELLLQQVAMLPG